MKSPAKISPPNTSAQLAEVESILRATIQHLEEQGFGPSVTISCRLQLDGRYSSMHHKTTMTVGIDNRGILTCRHPA